MALDIYKLTTEDYKILRAGGSVVKGDKVYRMDDDAVYVAYDIDTKISTLETGSTSLANEVSSVKTGLADVRKDAAAADVQITKLKDGQEILIKDTNGLSTKITEVASGLEAEVTNRKGDVANLTIIAGQIQQTAEDANGNASLAIQRADQIATQVTNLSDDVSTVRQTAQTLETEIADADKNISTLQQTATSFNTRISGAEKWIADEGVEKSEVATLVQENTGKYRGTYNSVAALDSITDPKTNDYAQVKLTDTAGNETITKYVYNGTAAWEAKETVSSVNFTPTQWNAINSGIDETKSKLISTNATSISNINQTMENITLEVDKKVDSAYFNETIGYYSTTEQMNSAIDQKADEINTSVKNTYETKADISENYYSKTETEGKINVKATEIEESVQSTYYTKTDAGTLETTLRGEITTTDSKVAAKVDKTQGTDTTGFGWELTDSNWSLKVSGEHEGDPDKTIFAVDKNGTVNIGGDVHVEGYVSTGEALNSTYNEFGVSTSPSIQPATWSQEAPAWSEGKYIWERTVNRFGIEGAYTFDYGKAVCIQGAKGEKGDPGSKGADGTSITIKPDKESCLNVGDGYINVDNGHLIMLACLDPERWQDCGKIQGPAGPEGQPGKSVFAVDISNDYDSIPASYDGVIKSDYNWEGQTTHTVKAYYGMSQITFKVIDTVPTEDNTEFSLLPTASNVTLEYSPSGEQVASYSAYISALTADAGNVTYTLYYGKKDMARCEFKAVKNKAGKEGDPAVDYWLTCTPSKIIKHKDGTLSGNSVTVNFWSQTGTDLAQACKSKYQYILNGTTHSSTEKVSSLIIQIPDEGLVDDLTVKMLGADTSIIYDTETISLIEDGRDGDSGEPASVLAIQNDYDSIPCDKDGNVKPGYDFATKTAHTIKVLSGTVEQAFTVSDTIPTSGLGYTVVYAASDVTYVPGTLNESVSSYTGSISAISADTGKVIYTLYKGTNIVASCKFEAVKLKTGADGNKGDDAVDYYIDCGTTVVKKKADGTLYPETVTFAFKKQAGNADPVDLDCYYTYSYDGGAITQGEGSSISIQTNNFINNVNVNIYKDAEKTVKYDSESVVIVADGLDGEDGEPGAPGVGAYSLDIQNDFDSIPCANDGTIVAYDWQGQTTHTIKAYCGMSQITFKVIDAVPTEDNTEFSLLPTASNVTLEYSPSGEQVASYSAYISALAAKNGNVTYTLYYGKTEIANCKFEATKQYSGADGKAATDYWITADTNVIQKNATGIISPTQIKLTFMKQVAGEKPTKVDTDEIYYEYNYNGSTFTGTNNEVTITTTAATTGIEVKLYNNATDKQVYDTETIPLVKDGLKGETGEQGPAGKDGANGKDGADGKSISVKASAADCTEIGDGYIDAVGHLQILNDKEARTFTDAGEIKGPKGDDGIPGADGEDGQSTIRLDILNDFDTIPCSSDGVIGEYDWVGQTTHTLVVYVGTLATQFTMSDTVPTSAGSDVVVCYQPSAITFVAVSDFDTKATQHQARISNLTDKTGKIDYTVYLGNVAVATGKFEAVKQYAGKDGEDGNSAVDYWLVPTVNKLRLKKDNTITPTSITANFYKQVGNDAPELYNGYYSYQFKGTPDSSRVYGSGQSVTIDTSLATSGLDIILYSDSTHAVKYDTESIPLITDGTDGKDGKDGVTPTKGVDYFDGTPGVSTPSVEISNDFVSLPCDSDGNIIGSPWESTTHTISVFSGIDQLEFKIVSSITGNKGYALNISTSNVTLPNTVPYGSTITGSFSTKIISLTANVGYVLYELYHDTQKIASAKFEAVKLLKGAKGEQGIQGLQGIQGEQGIEGPKGTDGTSSYFHIKYSEVAKPTEASEMTETPSTYIGTYVDNIATDSSDPNKYSWTKFIGKDGEKGTPGTNGIDGKTYYLHIAYATSEDGSEGFDKSVSVGKTYIGQYTDEIEEDSDDYTKYKWSKIKGEDGNDATTYKIVPTTTQIKKSKNSTSFDPSTLTVDFKYSAGTSDYTAFTDAYYTILTKYTDSTSTTLDGTGAQYTLNTISDNTSEIVVALYTDSARTILVDRETISVIYDGVDGDTYTTYIRYSEHEDGEDMVVTPTSATKYIGIVSTRETTCPAYTVFTWSKYAGTDGAKGKPGSDGKTYYTWIKYADDKDGNNMSDDPTGKKYIGLAHNKDTATESTIASDYTWSKYAGDDGVSKYTWVKYADTPTSGMADNPTNKNYIGFAYNKDSITESEEYSDYSWSLIKGATGNGISNIKYYYAVGNVETPPDPSTITSEALIIPTADNKYSWQKEVITFTDSSVQPQVTIVLLSRYGDDGEPGRSIAGVTNYYNSGVSGESAPAEIGDISWKTNPGEILHPLDNTYKYLWNYEVVTYSAGDPTTTTPTVIGTYGDTGLGIKRVTEYYLATSAASGVTTSTSGWTDTVQTMTATNKYLWNYEQITYSDDSKADPTTPCIIGSLGADGKTGTGVKSVVAQYAISNSDTSAPTEGSAWENAPQAYNKDKPYYWIRNLVTFDDAAETTSTTTPVLDQGLNDSYIQIRGKNRTTYSTTEPTYTPIVDGDLWFDTSTKTGDNTTAIALRQYDGTQWKVIDSDFVAGHITANKISAMDITTRKLEVLQTGETSKYLLKADGNSDIHSVQIGGFNVTDTGFYMGSDKLARTAGITAADTYIGVDGWSITGADTTYNYGAEINPSMVDVWQAGANDYHPQFLRIQPHQITFLKDFNESSIGTEIGHIQTTYTGIMNVVATDVLQLFSDTLHLRSDKIKLHPSTSTKNCTLVLDKTMLVLDKTMYGTVDPPTATEEGQIYFKIIQSANSGTSSDNSGGTVVES